MTGAGGVEPTAINDLVWDEQELGQLKADYPYPGPDTLDIETKYNPTPGTGRTGYLEVPPNNYPFYSEDEKYAAVMQADGGQLSEWQPMYNPTPEQVEIDRLAAYEAGIPHGYVPFGDKYRELPTIRMRVESWLHDDDEYGDIVDEDGRHSGGPFFIDVTTKMRVYDLRNVIRDKGGILPALQKLSYAGKYMLDPDRTLEHYGVAYWHKRFPDWPIRVRRCKASRNFNCNACMLFFMHGWVQARYTA